MSDATTSMLLAVRSFVLEEVGKLGQKLDRQDTTALEAVRAYVGDELTAAMAQAKAIAQASDLDILRSVQVAMDANTALATETRAALMHERTANRDTTAAWLSKIIDGESLLEELEAA